MEKQHRQSSFEMSLSSEEAKLRLMQCINNILENYRVPDNSQDNEVQNHMDEDKKQDNDGGEQDHLSISASSAKKNNNVHDNLLQNLDFHNQEEKILAVTLCATDWCTNVLRYIMCYIYIYIQHVIFICIYNMMCYIFYTVKVYKISIF